MQIQKADDTHTHTHKEHIIGLVQYTKEEGSGSKNLQLVMLC